MQIEPQDTEHIRAEQRIALLTRLYVTLSDVNEMVARARDAGELFRELCRICCTHMAFRLAYVALLEQDRMHVVAAHGASSFLEGLDLTLDPTRAEGQGPIATALREHRAYVCNDFASDPRTKPWRERAARIGTQATAAFPLLQGGQVVGVLSLHSPAIGFFDEAHTELLLHMTANVSYALDKLDKEFEAAVSQAALANLNRQLEQRVRARTAELELANKELESFSHSVSHDLRAPLRHVSGFVKLLQEDVADKLDPSAARYLDTIAAAAKRMGMLIDDLLSFSRTARLPLRMSPIELRQLVDTVVQELTPDSAQRPIEWNIGELPRVEGDPALLRVVLQNLLGNAVKYSRTRPLARIDVSAERDSEGRVVVRVRDNGVGFEMRYAQKLFGVFQRLHREDEFEGTGIGLAIAQRIVHRHGGKIWYEAELDRGATFFFTLSAADASRAPR